MSLRVDDGRSRGRSRSPGRRDERSRSRDARAPSPSVVIKMSTSKKYDSDESDSDTRSRKKSSKKHYDDDSESESDHRSKKKHSKRRDDSESSSESDSRSKKKHSRRNRDESDSDSKSKRKSHRKHHSDSDSDDKKKKKKPSKKRYDDSDSSSSSSEEDRRSTHKGSTTLVRTDRGDYVEVSKSKYTHEGHGTRYAQPQVISRPEGHRTHSGSASSHGTEYAQYHYADRNKYAPNGRKLSYTQSAEPQFAHGSYMAAPSEPKLHRLSISGGTSGAMLGLAAPGQAHMQGGLPPGSPLLEAYRGTYQSISPMPSPMMLASTGNDDVSDVESLDGDSDASRGYSRSTLKRKGVKTVSIYDPEPDALALAAALKHSMPDTKPIIKILPHLSDDHVLMLRTEYKKHMKSQGKGVNIAKHIKMKLSGNLGKVAYATALGRWESEAHWANFWYQSNTSRRELLIESLMGRTNSEIVKIKDAFSDQRYNNSLEKCMQTELKKDKFRNAVLLALEERRMSDNEKLSIDLVRKDAHDLYRALTAKEGGETAMINIIVVRSDKHLAEVLRVFEGQYHKNFAREMIKKSQNLVGETLAHIINGVLNKPVRDALLLHQALAETSKDRSDLLVSRLVRFHWEPRHMERIKAAYKQKYDIRLERAVEEGTKGEFGAFCVALCKIEL